MKAKYLIFLIIGLVLVLGGMITAGASMGYFVDVPSIIRAPRKTQFWHFCA